MSTMIEKIADIIFGSIHPYVYPDFTMEQKYDPKPWVDLTEDELKSCLPIAKLTGKPGVWFTTAHAMSALRAAEAKLKEKNW